MDRDTDKREDQPPTLQQLRRKALDLLAQREHSVSEMTGKLRRRLPGASPADIQTVLTALEDEGLLSDRRFAEAYVSMRCRKGYGPQRIALELNEKGIAPALADAALAERDDWLDLAQREWQKKFRSPPTSYEEKARHMRFLQYRGFSAETIRTLLE